ncbi:nitrogenase component 1 [Mediterraneibacter faecis]|jgi:nitrogenase molybdenum-iron protein alpha/beta subunit|uniref:nitrogenase component 1 n=1 Tax=Mediterraneibacter faecis TaxID=592978 RepID=UPI002ED0AB15
MKKAYFCTAEELEQRGKDNLPKQFQSGEHLIYSSPATLAFNSPGAEGFGVKRAGLAVPGSIMLIVAPGCCGRNTSMISSMKEYNNRFFYLCMDETDIVTGRHLKKIPKAVASICESLEKKPSVVMICITCVDALLGTDMERVCRKAEEKAGLPVRPCYMYALTREGRKPPMVHVRQSLYSLLEPGHKKGNVVNLLGYFSPLVDDCELYTLLQEAGVKTIHEISRCEDFEEYKKMSEANFNLVLHPEARFAAEDFHDRLKIPFIELRRLYQIDKIGSQYQAFGAALGIEFHAEEQKKQAQKAIESFRKVCPDPVFAVGECANADPFELSLALVKYGFKVAEIYGTITGENFIYIRQLKKLSPQTKIFSNMEPTMLYYDPTESGVTLTIGKDACYYHPNTKGIHWNEERQPFGYAGVRRLFEALELAVTELAEGNVLQKQVEVIGSKSQEAIAEQSQESLFKEEVDKKEDVYVRGLWKGLTPFAPDQSGAASVFYELGGILVICDAGGCTGNVCGFDEPRWFGERSAIFSAGLRDMDAILGRDDRLVAKLTDAAEKIDANFAAVIGTPVPAVIATDYRALQRMCEKKTNLPILTVDTNGMELYDVGEEKAWLTLFKTFAGKDVASQKEASEEDDSSKKMKIGVLGLTPHDVSDLNIEEKFRKSENENTHYICYGMRAGIDKVKTAGSADKNLVVAPAALETAKYLEKEFGTPYEVGYPFVDELIPELGYERKKILIIHQQVIANAIRQEIRTRSDEQNTEVTVASWFMMKSELSEEGDLSLKEEMDYCKRVQNGNYDIVFADENMRGLVPGFKGTFVNVRHFAVSGKLQES